MKKAVKPESNPRPALTRELVLHAAMKIMDEDGIDTLSMRALGARLGVEAMSLYNHATNKDDIIDGALDLVLEEIAIPEPDTDWRVAMRERAVSARDAFRRHPWASALVDSRLSASPSRFRYFDAILGSLSRAGFPIETAAHAFSILDCFVYGFCRQMGNMASGGEMDQEKKATTLLEGIQSESFPYLARMAELASRQGYDEDADFDFALKLILDGLERLLPGSVPTRP